jgi:hypothetical protein
VIDTCNVNGHAAMHVGLRTILAKPLSMWVQAGSGATAKRCT